MGSLVDIYTLYRAGEKHLLLRNRRPAFASWSQRQDNFAHELAMKKRDALLEHSRRHFGIEEAERLGEMWESAFGEALYQQDPFPEVQLFYIDTSNGHPWIILSAAESEEEFLEQLKEETGLLALGPMGAPTAVRVTLVRENDFDLSGIPYHDCLDVRSLWE